MKGIVTEEFVSKFSFPCSCGHGELQFTQWKDDGYGYINYVLPAFSSYQIGTLERIGKALSIFWELVVMGREYRLYEIVIEDNEMLQKFRNFVADMRDINEQDS